MLRSGQHKTILITFHIVDTRAGPEQTRTRVARVSWRKWGLGTIVTGLFWCFRVYGTIVGVWIGVTQMRHIVGGGVCDSVGANSKVSEQECSDFGLVDKQRVSGVCR